MKARYLALTIIAILVLAYLPLTLGAEELKIKKEGWLDEVVFISEKDRAKAIDMMIKGDIHIYFIDIGDPTLFKKIKESPELTYDFSYGLYFELTFNPVGPEFPKTGELNPFSNPRIREAMNYIVDRKYIVDEIMGGLATPKFVPICHGFPEYERFKDVIKEIEEEYKYDFEKGKKIIFEEMKKMGAEFKDGKWYYKGKPVVIKFIIRVEDQRKAIGDYVASQLEKLGFTVERMYKTSKEAAALWIRGDPAEGKWHMYTGGWITTAVTRDDADNFAFFYTPIGLPIPLWQAYKPAPEFFEVAKKLAEKQFKTMEERAELMRKAFKLAMKDSVRVWLVDQNAAWVRRKEVFAVADYAAGYATPIWPYTLRFEGKEGGTMRIASAEVFVDPWNPVAGSDWIYDTMVQWATMHADFVTHPKTGLPIPIMVKKVKMEVAKGTLTFRNPETKDWFEFKVVDKVEVPPDAWYAWDAKKKKMVTAGEAGVKAAVAKVVAEFGDVIGKHRYHDGSVMSLADWILPFILIFERADESSPLYDEAAVEDFKVWRQNFVAWRIVSEHPLIIEYYINYTALDAEIMADWAIDWPAIPWHVYTIGIIAEEEGKLAFSSGKAKAKGVEWMNYLGGPSISVLADIVKRAEKEGYIPFKEFLGKYISADDAKKRFANLRKWHEKYGHFWVGDGPYFLEHVDITGHTCTAKNAAKYLAKPAAPIATTTIIIIAVIVVIIAVAAALFFIGGRKKKAAAPAAAPSEGGESPSA